MNGQIVTDEQVASYRRDGFLFLPGVFDADRMREITHWADELEAWPEAPGKYMKYFEDSRIGSGERVLNRIEDFVPYHDGMRALLTDGGLVEIVGALFGEPPVLFKEKINFKMPGGGGFDPHQDAQAGWNDFADLFASVMVTIDECTLDNGCLEVAHWRHRHELIGELWRPLQDDELSDVEFVPYPTKPGDVLVFDSYIPHRSAPNNSPSSRRVLYVTYNRQSDGDHRAQYYAAKRASYPPDCEREPGKDYAYRV